MTAADSRSGVVSRRAAVSVAVTFALLVGVLVDAAGVAALGVLGAVVTGWGASALAAERKRRVAFGSVALALGSTTLVAGLALAFWADVAGYAVVVLGAFAVTVATGEAFSAAVTGRTQSAGSGSLALALGGGVLLVGFVLAVSAGLAAHAALVAGFAVLAVVTGGGVSTEGVERFKRGVSELGFVSVVALVVLATWHLLVASGFLWIVVRRLFAAAVAEPLGALWWLQIFVLAVGVLTDRATRAVRRWTPGEATGRGGLVETFRLAPGDVPRWYLVALVVQYVGVSLLSGPVESFLTTRPLLDRVVEVAVLSGVVHAALGVVAVLLACVALAPTLQRATVFWTGASPGYTLAFAAGGLVAVAVSVAWAAFLALARAFGLGDPTAGTGMLFAVLGPAVPVLAGVFGAVLVTATLVLGVRALTARTQSTGGVAVGAAMLFTGTALLADALPAVVVAVGAGVSLLVWDLGAQAAGFDLDLRGVRPPVHTELVHVSAAAAALFGGVVVATAVGYFAVPLPVAGDHATAALSLAIVSVVAFAFAFRR